jgi:polyphosphate kinase
VERVKTHVKLALVVREEPDGIRRYVHVGTADLMTRNLSRRMEAVAPVCDPVIKGELENILHTYEDDNCSAWDMQPDGEYIRRHPAAGEAPREAQQVFIERSAPR